MTIYLNRTTYADVQGASRTGQLLGVANTLNTITGQIIAVSNADYVTTSTGVLVVNPVFNPVGLQYISVRDQANLVFQTSAGTVVTITIPAPQTAVFEADGESVDPASVAGVIAACIGLLCDPSGNVVTSFVAGYRSRLQ